MFKRFFDSFLDGARNKAATLIAEQAKEAVSKKIKAEIDAILPDDEPETREQRPEPAEIVALRNKRDDADRKRAEEERTKKLADAEKVRLKEAVARKIREEREIDDELSALKKRLNK